MKRLICTALLLTAAGMACAENWMVNPNVVDDDKPWEEQQFVIPDYPTDPQWLPFQVSNTYHNNAYIDGKSAQIGKDQAIRMIVRVSSPSGAENLSYEGLLCKEKQINIYAYGDTYNKRWITASRRAWREIPTDDQMHQRLLKLVCKDSTPRSNEALIQLFIEDAQQKMPDRGPRL